MSADSDVALSFVIPFRNEARFLAATLDSLLRQELSPGRRAEILLIDGASDDGSRVIADEYAGRFRPPLLLRVLDNPERRTPVAFNRGIAAAGAPAIGFGGAHTIYPPHYFQTALEVLEATGADVVGGGHDDIRPDGDGAVARAVAFLYKSPLGAGVAAYHRRRTAGYVDTVYGGFYGKDVLRRAGGFNEALTRNQDNELNARIVAAGGRIYFDPRLSTSYVQKGDVRTFLSRGYTFGRYHPATWRATPRAFRVRHAVPLCFVLYLLTLPIAPIGGGMWWWLWAPAGLYALLLMASAAVIAWRATPMVGLLTIPLFAAYHVVYGSGTLIGLMRPRN